MAALELVESSGRMNHVINLALLEPKFYRGGRRTDPRTRLRPQDAQEDDRAAVLAVVWTPYDIYEETNPPPAD